MDGAPTPAPGPVDDGDRAYQDLLAAARHLVDRVHRREDEVRRLLRVTENLNRGLGLDEVLEFLYQELRPVIPFNRIGCALLDEATGMVVSRWAKSDRPVRLGVGFRAPLAGSTLADVVRTGRPRVLNDLEAYLRDKPRSGSTALIVAEGMRSSLTCPLVVRGRPVGFLFFSSDRPGTYSGAQVEFFREIAGQVALIVEKARLYSELADQAAVIGRQNKQLLRELELARQFQRAMIPGEGLRPPGLALAFAYRPATQVGGDLLDVLPLADGRTLVFVGDAMGHGVDAAMVMAATKTALLTAARATADPGELLGRVNEALAGMLAGERFVTAVCARLDPAAGRAEVAVAGHPNPLHVGPGGAVTRPGDGGVPLGVKPGAAFPAAGCRFGPGDTLVLFTDGVVEARDPDGRGYGEDRLRDLVAGRAGAGPAGLLHALEADLREFARGREHDDDLTVLVARAAPDGGSGPG